MVESTNILNIYNVSIYHIGATQSYISIYFGVKQQALQCFNELIDFFLFNSLKYKIY